MDKKKTSGRVGLFDGAIRTFKREAQRRKSERGALIMDIAIFLIALFFSRRHIVFGAYPLAAALIATLPSRVWVALLGSLFGAFSLGRTGLIHAIISVITVFLRIIISGNAKNKDGEEQILFSEPYVMRVAAAAIGSFIGAFYEILLGGFALSSILFGCTGVLLTVAFSFSYFGVFSSDISVSDVVSGTKNIFTGKKSQRESIGLLLFQGSFMVFCFLIVFSLDGYDFFGISLSYIFVGGITLFVAKRFGAIRAAAVGFISAIGISAVGAVGFALAGLAAGLLFSYGLGYALFGGAGALCAWCAYAGGMTEFLSTIPEYGVAAMLITPYLKGAKKEHEPEVGEHISKTTAEMVNSMANSYRERTAGGGTLEDSLLFAAGAIKEYGVGGERGEFDEYRNIVIALTASLDPTPCEENIDALASKLYKKSRITADDIARIFSLNEGSEELLDELLRLVGEYERECYELCRMDALAKEYELISKMINDEKYKCDRETLVDNELSNKLTGIFASLGFPDGSVKVLGDRRKHVIAAGEDPDGTLITAPKVKEELERAIGIKLSKPEYFKRGEIALLECTSAPVWKIEHAFASSASPKTGLSGDSVSFFERDGVFFSLISDGMGSGLVAQRTSRFACDYLSHMLAYGSAQVAMTALNHIIKYRAEECSATVDIFSFDLISGEGTFTKCGAAPSYVKHTDSIFRIRSHTAPIGLIRSVDSEQIRVEIKSGDYVVMLSDGVALLPEEVPWLLEFLDRPSTSTAQEYADEILSLALANSKTNDDITVSVVKILAA